MIPGQVILLVIFVINAAISLSVYFTNSKRSQNRLFLLFSSSLSVWVIFVFSIAYAKTELSAAIGIRGASIAGASIPVTFYIFCQAIAAPHLKLRQLFLKSRAMLLLSVIVAGMCCTSFFLQEVTLPNPTNQLRIPEADYGYGFFVFMAFFPLVIYRTIYVFYKTLRFSKGMPKAEMQFALIGMTSALPVALIIHVLAIISGSSQPQQYGPLCIIPMNLVIAYGIATRRILGIERIIRQAMAYALLAGSLGLVYFACWHAMNYLLSDVMKDPSMVAQITAIVVTLISQSPIQHHIRAATTKLIGTKSMDVSGTMKQAGEIFQSVYAVDTLSKHFSQLVQHALNAKSIRIISLEKNQSALNYSTESIAIDKAISTESALIQMAASSKDTICKDTLSRVRETELSIRVQKELNELGANMAVGIFSKSVLSGLLLAGPKKGGGFYDKTELDAIQILCNQFAVALENAQLYTEMQDSKIRNEIMLDQLVSGVIVASPDRTITLFNHEAQRITGIPDDAAIGKPIGILPRAIQMALETTLETKTGVRNMDATLYNPDTEEESANIRMGSAFLLGHDGKPMGALLVFTDITELKGLEEQVRRTDQLSSVGTLAAGMAHEIKNPLVTIKTFSQLLPKRYNDEDFRHDFSSLVAHEVSRIDGIVNELLSFSKPAKPHLIPMKLQDTIAQTLKLTHEQRALNHIDLTTKYNASNDEIFGDAKLLSQALINLKLNAIEAIGEGGNITIGTINCNYRFASPDSRERATTKKCIRLQITDTGKGIERDKLQKIFDPFFTSKSEGTGMGLSVAHGIISEHHGVIEVESEPGRGTTFYVYIPVLEEGIAK